MIFCITFVTEGRNEGREGEGGRQGGKEGSRGREFFKITVAIG